MTETELIQEFMFRAGRDIPYVRLFRRNILKLPVEDRVVKAGIKGQADLYAYLRGGNVVEIEAKAKRGKFSREQEQWRDWCKAWKVPWMSVKVSKGETDNETVDRWVRELRHQAEQVRLQTT